MHNVNLKMRKHEAHQSEATYSDIKTHLADFMRDFYEQTEDSACGRARFAESEGAAERPPVLVQVKPFGAAVVLSHVLILRESPAGEGLRLRNAQMVVWPCGQARGCDKGKSSKNKIGFRAARISAVRPAYGSTESLVQTSRIHNQPFG